MRYLKKTEHTETGFKFSPTRTLHNVTQNVAEMVDSMAVNPDVLMVINSFKEQVGHEGLMRLDKALLFVAALDDFVAKYGIASLYPNCYDLAYDPSIGKSIKYNTKVYVGEKECNATFNQTALGMKVGDGRFFAIKKVYDCEWTVGGVTSSDREYVIDFVKTGAALETNKMAHRDIVDLAYVMNKQMINSKISGIFNHHYDHLSKNGKVLKALQAAKERVGVK